MEAAGVASDLHEQHGDHHGPPAPHFSSAVDPQTLGMYLFIISEVMLFGAFFTAYFFIRVVKGDSWPAAGHEIPVLLGLTFLSVQINEYFHLGWAIHDNAQGSIFYGLTGLHGAHVTVGLILLAMANIRAFRGHFSPEQHRGVEVPGIYWHFVDIMWIVVFTTVYIL